MHQKSKPKYGKCQGGQKMENLIFKAINQKIGVGRILLQDVQAMKPIQKSSKSGGYNIFAIQYGDLTLLVWVNQNEVKKVKTVAW